MTCTHCILVLCIALFSVATGQPRPLTPHPNRLKIGRIAAEELGEILEYCRLPPVQRWKRDQEAVIPSERIFAGQNAEPGEFPAAVWLGFWKKRESLQVCGGTLITRWHIITASHCFVGKGFPTGYNLEVRIGGVCNGRDEHCANLLHNTDKMRDVYWEHAFWQSNFNQSGSHNNDLAIIQLKYPVADSPNEHFACLLPSTFGHLNRVHYVTVIGWGMHIRPTVLPGVLANGPPQANWPADMYPMVLQKAINGRLINPDLRTFFPDANPFAEYGVIFTQPSPYSVVDSEKVTLGMGDSGSGIYLFEHGMIRLVAVHSGTTNYAGGPMRTWITYHQDLTYRHWELCYYIGLCIPPYTVDNLPNEKNRSLNTFLRLNTQATCVPTQHQRCG